MTTNSANLQPYDPIHNRKLTIFPTIIAYIFTLVNIEKARLARVLARVYTQKVDLP